MAHEKVYAYCENMCREESLTKEQIETQILKDSGVPKDAIIEFEGDEIPEGFEEVGEDTGWIDIDLEDGITEGTVGTPQYRKIGNHVFIRGSYGGTKGTGALLLGTLPTGSRPENYVYDFSAGNGIRIFRTYVSQDGGIFLEWVYPVGSNTEWTGTFTWLNVEMDFFVD